MNIIHYLGKGVYHEDNKIPCQDYANHCYAANGNIIMALSDGCSSAQYSEDASRISVESVINYFEKHSIEEFRNNKNNKTELIQHIKNSFLKFNKKKYEISPSQFSATLLFVVMNNECVITGHIGDGNIVCCDKTGRISLYSDAENGNASNQTYFVVDSDAEEHFRIEYIDKKNVNEVILYSDGPQKMFYYIGNKSTETAAAGLLTEVFDNKINNCNQLADRLADLTANSMFQLMDDWSVLIYSENQIQCEDITFKPVSMKERFMKGFINENRI